MTSRRDFLTQAGIFTAASLLSPNVLNGNTLSRNIGIQLYSLRDQVSQNLGEVIKQIAKAGYDEVETFGFSKTNGFWGLSAKSFKEMLSASGLKSPSGHYGLNELFSEGKLDDVKLCIDTAKALGQQYLIVPFLSEAVRRSADDFKKVAERINIAAGLCDRAGIKLAYHNHDFEFYTKDGTTLFEVLMKESDPKLVDFELDLFWVVRAGEDPIVLLNKYPDRFKLVHVKDMAMKNINKNTEIGNGSISYPRIISKAKQWGVKHFIMEQENFDIDPYLSIAKSHAYMKNVLHV